MRTESLAAKMPAKKPYVTPKLLTHGGVEKLTEHLPEHDHKDHDHGSSLPFTSIWK